MSISEAQKDVASLIKRASEDKERVILTDQGKAVAVVPIEDLETTGGT